MQAKNLLQQGCVCVSCAQCATIAGPRAKFRINFEEFGELQREFVH